MLLSDLFNILDQINWFVSLLGAIAISVVGNLITPAANDILKRQTGKRINDKIKNLEQVKEEISNYTSNPLLLSSYVNESLLKVFLLFAVANAIAIFGFFGGAFYMFTQAVMIMLYYYAAMIALKTLSTCKKVRNASKQITLINEEIKKAEIKLGNVNN